VIQKKDHLHDYKAGALAAVAAAIEQLPVRKNGIGSRYIVDIINSWVMSDQDRVCSCT
jgi:hypothetical protein